MKKYRRTPTTNLPIFSHHTRLGCTYSFVPYWSARSEPWSPLLYWFLDFATHWCASSRIHQNFALQVGFLPSNQIFLSLTSCRWFHAHCPIQLLITGPVIFAGWALGHQTTTRQEHFQDPHQKIGLALLILYVLQLTIGAFVHFF